MLKRNKLINLGHFTLFRKVFNLNGKVAYVKNAKTNESIVQMALDQQPYIPIFSKQEEGDKDAIIKQLMIFIANKYRKTFSQIKDTEE